MLSPDFREFARLLNKNDVQYLVVGGYAVALHGHPRYTKDLDVWVPAALNDPQHVYEALKAFGAPLRGITPEDFQDPKMFLQIGVAPVRVDILVGLPGVSAEEAWKHRTRSRYGKTPIHVLGLAELIKAKKATGRPQDRLDLAKLLRKARQKR